MIAGQVGVVARLWSLIVAASIGALRKRVARLSAAVL